MKYFRRQTRHLRQDFLFGFLAVGLFLTLPAMTFAAPGDLDLSFGSGGIVVTSISNAPYFEYASSMKVQPDGKIVVSGEIIEEIPDGGIYVSFFLARYHPNGTLDTSFGTNGKIVAPINSGDELVGRDIALQPDGKIVAVGFRGVNRYNSDGTLDASFGTGGKVLTPFETRDVTASSVAIQADGKIVVVGSNNSSSGFFVVRYNTNGSLDTSFGTGGKVFTNFNIGGGAFAVMLQPDGKIVAAGAAGIQNPGFFISGFALARYNTDGSLDSGFGAGGKVIHAVPGTISGGSGISDVALQPDGKIVATGWSEPGSAIVRYNANGSIDTSFAQNGIFTTEANFNVSGIDLQSNGKIVAFGSAGNNSRAFAIARLNPNGTPDTSFGTNGRVITPINSSSGAAGGAIQSDGKILAFGSTNTPNSDSSDIAIVRYLGDSVVARRTPFDFDGDGRADVSVYRPSDGVWFIQNSSTGLYAIQFGAADDKLVPADYDGDGRTDVAVYRNGNWILQRSRDGFASLDFGSPGDIPVPADYDGDGRAEIAVYRPGSGDWLTLNLVNNAFSSTPFGTPEDKPVTGDYDGDGKSDYAVYRPSDGAWYMMNSKEGFYAIQFGAATDEPVPGDYDGDGRTDVAVYRASEGYWYIFGSKDGLSGAQFGIPTDFPVAADYDGDGKTDIAVYRPEGGYWHLQKSTEGFASIQFGVPSDLPVPNALFPSDSACPGCWDY
jgi:uncharacterized delta-60 repeat protein